MKEETKHKLRAFGVRGLSLVCAISLALSTLTLPVSAGAIGNEQPSTAPTSSQLPPDESTSNKSNPDDADKSELGDTDSDEPELDKSELDDAESDKNEPDKSTTDDAESDKPETDEADKSTTDEPAPRMYQLTITLKDKHDTGIEKVEVKLSDDEKTLFTGYTDKAGAVLVDELPTGEYQLSAEAEGYVSITSTITVDKEDKEVNLTMALQTFEIATSVGAGGKVEVDKKSVAYQEDATISVVADEGYEIDTVTVNGTSIKDKLENGEYTLKNITEKKTVSATFKKLAYQIEVTIDENGNLYKKGHEKAGTVFTVEHGDTFEYVVKAKDGYRIQSVVEDDAEVSEIFDNASESYEGSIASVKKAHTIKVTFTAKIYQVELELKNTTTYGELDIIYNGVSILQEAGADESNPKLTCAYGSQLELTVCASEFYQVKLKAKDEAVIIEEKASKTKDEIISTNHIISNFTQDTKLSVELVPNCYTVHTWNPLGDNKDLIYTSDDGTNVILPDPDAVDGYIFDGWYYAKSGKVDATCNKVSEIAYTEHKNADVYAVWKIDADTVEVAATPSGKAVTNASGDVWYTGSVEITLNPVAKDLKWSYQKSDDTNITELDSNTLTIGETVATVVEDYAFKAEATGLINAVCYTYVTSEDVTLTVRQDAQKPSVTLSQEGKSFLDNLMNHILTKRQNQGEDTYEVISNDSGSGVETQEYQYIDFRAVQALREDELIAYLNEKGVWTPFSGTELTLNPVTEGEWVLVVRVTDYTGHAAYRDSTGTLFDQTAPEVSVELNYQDAEGQEAVVTDSTVIYSAGDITGTITVTDDMLVYSDMTAATDYRQTDYYTVKFGGDSIEVTPKALSYVDNHYIWTGTFTLSADSYQNQNGTLLEVQASDISGNLPDDSAPQFTSGELYIDTIAPTIDIEYSDYVNKSEETEAIYSNKAVKMTVTVTDEHLDLNTVQVKNASDSNATVDLMNTDVCQYTQEGNQHIYEITIPFENGGIYQVDATDLAGRKAETANSYEFKFDNTKPVVDIRYSYVIAGDEKTNEVHVDPDSGVLESESFNATNNGYNYSQGDIKAHITISDDSGLSLGKVFDFYRDSITMMAVSGTLQNTAIHLQNEEMNQNETQWSGDFIISRDDYANQGDFQLNLVVEDFYGNSTAYTSENLAVDSKKAQITAVTLDIENDNLLAKTIHFFTFGLFFNKQAVLSVNYSDNDAENEVLGSGVVSVVAQIVDEQQPDKQKEYSETFTIDEAVSSDGTAKLLIPQEDIDAILAGNLKIVVTDLVGNVLSQANLTEVYQSAKGNYVMAETSAPVISDNHADEEEPITYQQKDSKGNTTSYWMLKDAMLRIAVNDATVDEEENPLKASGLHQVTLTDNAESVETSRTGTYELATKVEAIDSTYTYAGEEAVKVEVDGVEEPLTQATPDMNYHIAYENLKANSANVFSVNAVDNCFNKAETDTFTVYQDTIAPALDSITLNAAGWNDEYNLLAFGAFYNGDVTVIAQAHDGEDGLPSAGMQNASIVYTKSDDSQIIAETALREEDFNANITEKTTATATATLTAPENAAFEGTVSVELIDNVNNIAEKEATVVSGFMTNGEAPEQTNVTTLMLDTVKPEVGTVVTTPRNNWNGDEALAKGDNWYNTTDIRYSIPVSDKDSGIRLVTVTLNGDEVTMPDTVWEYYQLDTKTTEQTVELNLKDLVDYQSKTVVQEGENTLTVQVTDNAGNTSEVYSDTVYIDMTAPVVVNYQFEPLEYQDSADKDGMANVVVETKYGYYFKKAVKVTAFVVDNSLSSGIYQVVYKAIDKETGKAVVSGVAEKFDVVDGNTVKVCAANVEGSTSACYTFTIPASFKGQIYAYAVDHVNNLPKDEAGEPEFVSPDKAVVETAKKHLETSSIVFEKANTPFRTTDQQELYGGDVAVTMNVEDLYSGIRKVEWTLESPEDKGNNQSGVVTINNNGGFSGDSGWNNKNKTLDENLVTKISKTITVKNNSNSIVLNVTLTDRAGNISAEKIMFSIDKTKPVIAVAYDNNSPDGANNKYYKADRTASITITERNFDEKGVALKISNTLSGTPAFSKWTRHAAHAGYASDADTYTATITFHDDGDYTFDLGFHDIVGNAALPYHDDFTIDETVPVMNVTFTKSDGSSVGFDEYSSSAVTASIQITERNFDSGRVNCSMSHDGGSYPVSLSWGRGGDSNTASIVLNGDAHYTFDISSTDMAGNDAAPFTQYAFYVDETDPVITLSGIKKANSGRDEGGNRIEVTPVINVDDKYFSNGSVTFELTRANGEPITSGGERSSYLNEDSVSAENGKYTFKNLVADDLYTLKVNATDLSGRVQTKMLLDSGMEEQSTAEGVEAYTFSVNRDGTVYVYSNGLKELIGAENRYYQPSYVAEKELSVYAYDVEPLLEGETKLSISRDGAMIDAMQSSYNKAGRINESGDYNQWYEYTFNLAKQDFEKDGFYDVVISDKDNSGNVRTNGENPISFYVDGTAPVFDSIIGLEKAQVNKNELTVEYSITDAFALSRVDVIVDGNTQSVDKFDGTTYTGTFTVGSGLRHTVALCAVDLAGNTLSTNDKEFIPGFEFNRTVTVSTNPAILWYSNTPLFVGTLVAAGSAVVGAAGVATFRVVKARKAEEATEEEE